MAAATDDHRRFLDAYLQGAHLALFAMEGKLLEAGVLDAGEVKAILAELHEVFASSRRALKDGSAPPLGLVPYPLGKN